VCSVKSFRQAAREEARRHGHATSVENMPCSKHCSKFTLAKAGPRISEPYFNSKLNYWGIKVNEKEEIKALCHG